jgi:hypothetical protein
VNQFIVSSLAARMNVKQTMPYHKNNPETPKSKQTPTKKVI